MNKYINRDLSWLQFNRRVLEEAQDNNTPLLERAKFLSIVSTNLDEFVSVRVAGIMDKIKAGNVESDFTGFTPPELLNEIERMIDQLIKDQYQAHDRIIRLLKNEGIAFTTYGELDDDQKKEMEAYYFQWVFPVLTPLAVDKSRPFPLVRSKSVYLAVVLKQSADISDMETHVALVEIPANLSRFIEVSSQIDSKKRYFILLEDLIKGHMHTLFNLYSPVAFHSFRLTRNADLVVDEEGSDDLLDEMEKVLRKRKRGTPVRLEIEKGFDLAALELIKNELEIDHHLLITAEGPVDLSFYMQFASSITGYEHLKYPKFEPMYPREFSHTDDFFSVLRKRDVVVYHPYESFEAVTDFIGQSAADPDVLAIKMTLYRVNGDSRIIQALIRAAEAGKQVTVIVELKARFDEARNIEWAKELERAGCHVVYGLAGLKIHCKMTLVVRREADSLNRYIHVASGNYNEVSARLFTDIGLFTSDPDICEDVANVFNKITGFYIPRSWHYLDVAPTHLKQRLFSLIRRESENASLGKAARIIVKVNALANQEVTDQLYAASQAGVRIDLIVRGICTLRPGIPGLSDNIAVRSIVDRFLEHSRVFYFKNAGSPQVWVSSSDWMTRNLDHRIELMCPILDHRQKSILIHYLMLLLDDNVKARQLLPDGSYIRVDNQKLSCRSQLEAKDLVMVKYSSSAIPMKDEEIAVPLENYIEHDNHKPVIYH
ncbi:polyphosphate kinase 1 [Paenibacillus sedimenti]|uniref:Polyphosphate kinase n=1 Tax=Paenibacillus sedimenti TaxID=2770274 RepID=A0A926KVU1_9BACL|nr:polyphosphate kinase 1 [Paenibacillus sedimenti]MBD0384243.1 polyphosphate kinase 1 [Paenibacillus sedimenti]